MTHTPVCVCVRACDIGSQKTVSLTIASFVLNIWNDNLTPFYTYYVLIDLIYDSPVKAFFFSSHAHIKTSVLHVVSRKQVGNLIFVE